MLRELLKTQKQTSTDGFRFRGLESTRLTNLTDAIFGFAITLLVISSEVPQTYVELQASMYSFMGFVFCIMLLFDIWSSHYKFTKRYGLEDKTTRTLNFLMLFVLLFYVYPLKYLFSYIGTLLLVKLMTLIGDNSEAFQLAVSELSKANLDANQWKDIMIRFGLGIALIHVFFMLMHWNALKLKDELYLNSREIFLTKTYAQVYGIVVFVSIISMLIVMVMGGRWADLSGGAYLLIAIFISLHKRFRKKRWAILSSTTTMVEEQTEPVEIEPNPISEKIVDDSQKTEEQSKDSN